MMVAFMKVAYAVGGSRGDTQPHIAFAVELARAGYEVRLWIPRDYESLVPKIKGLSVYHSHHTVASGLERMAPFIATGKMNDAFGEMFAMQAEQFGSDANSVRAMCEGWADILIYNGVLGRVAMAVTEALMLKMIAVNVQPMLPTREAFPMGGKMKLPKFLHLFFWWLLMSKLAFPAVLQRAIAEWKAANGCKLPPLDPWEETYRFNVPHIFGFSPATFAPPADWAALDYEVTADWVLNADDLPERPSPELARFLTAKLEPPLYVGWGSMAHESGGYMTELAVRALYGIGKRGIVFAGSTGSELFRLGLDRLDSTKPDAAAVLAWAEENILVTSGVSHEWLLPKCAAAVHHGGAGTSAACFRSGVPSIVTPFNFDQFTFARLAVEQGLGPGPLPEFKAVTPEVLGAALLAAAHEPQYRAAASALREKMKLERGTKLAVEAFERLRHRDIWKEEAKRQQCGVPYAVAPPSFFCCLESKQARAIGPAGPVA